MRATVCALIIQKHSKEQARPPSVCVKVGITKCIHLQHCLADGSVRNVNLVNFVMTTPTNPARLIQCPKEMLKVFWIASVQLDSQMQVNKQSRSCVWTALQTPTARVVGTSPPA